MFARGERFMDVNADGEDVPVFCEVFLYSRVGKGDARFILAVADEYETLIKHYGSKKIQEMLAEARAGTDGTGIEPVDVSPPTA